MISGTCDGCNLQNPIRGNSCVVKPSFELQGRQCDCPCQICLVKPMCLSPCEPFKTYLEDYYELVKTSVSEYVSFFSKLIAEDNPNSKHAISYMRSIPMYMKFQDILTDIDFDKSIPKLLKKQMIDTSYYS